MEEYTNAEIIRIGNLQYPENIEQIRILNEKVEKREKEKENLINKSISKKMNKSKITEFELPTEKHTLIVDVKSYFIHSAYKGTHDEIVNSIYYSLFKKTATNYFTESINIEFLIPYIFNSCDSYLIHYISSFEKKTHKIKYPSVSFIIFKIKDVLFYIKHDLFIKNNILIFHNLSSTHVYLMTSNPNCDEYNKLIKDLSEHENIHKIEKTKTICHLIVENLQGLILKEFEVNNTRKLSLSMLYGKEFYNKDIKIKKELLKKENKGLVILHGNPGTGKTNYIRHLIYYLCRKKKVIYISPDMVHVLSSPNFLSFIMNYKNSILLIEDAENILQKRTGGNNQSVANLLNISDGILGDSLKIQIICTFNADINTIDDALLRKGRLIEKHEFKKLSKDQSQRVIDHYRLNYKATGEMSLAEIFNKEESDYTKKTEKVGFKNLN